MTEALGGTATLSPSLLGGLPETVEVPRYDRNDLAVGVAHIGVGAFHRCHQAEFTDDLLNERFDRRGVVGINIREPRLATTLGRQDGLFTRLLRDDRRVDARVIGCLVETIDGQESSDAALRALAAAEVEAITLTVTEKGYCHRPASGELDAGLSDVRHDLANPTAPRSLPGLLVQAFELRMRSHGRPVTVISCDNIPANGVILGNVVRGMAESRGAELKRWMADNVAFPSTMVDRIVPATAAADLETVEQNFGYRDLATVVGEPFRQWVIEDNFVSSVPRWDLVGATFVADVAPFELLKMRVLNAAQSALAYLGLLAGYEHTCDDMTDETLVAFVRRMLVEESIPTIPAVPGILPDRYLEQCFGRLRNRAIRHRNHQIATDGSQKIVQRFLNPIIERLRRGESVELLAVAVAAWVAYLAYASTRLGARWSVADPLGNRVAALAERAGRHSEVLAADVLAIETIFDRELHERRDFRATVARHLGGLLSDAPIAYVRGLLQ